MCRGLGHVLSTTSEAKAGFTSRPTLHECICLTEYAQYAHIHNLGSTRRVKSAPRTHLDCVALKTTCSPLTLALTFHSLAHLHTHPSHWVFSITCSIETMDLNWGHGNGSLFCAFCLSTTFCPLVRPTLTSPSLSNEVQKPRPALAGWELSSRIPRFSTSGPDLTVTVVIPRSAGILPFPPSPWAREH